MWTKICSAFVIATHKRQKSVFDFGSLVFLRHLHKKTANTKAFVFNVFKDSCHNVQKWFFLWWDELLFAGLSKEQLLLGYASTNSNRKGRWTTKTREYQLLAKIYENCFQTLTLTWLDQTETASGWVHFPKNWQIVETLVI